MRANIVCPATGNPEMHFDLVGKERSGEILAEGPKTPGQESADELVTGMDLRPIAAVALFLASDESRYCTGAGFVADNGMQGGPVIDIPGVWTSEV